jgi:tetratricopeptide (TPR) repeat protein
LSRERFLNVKLDADERADLFERLIGERGALATCVVDSSEDTVAVLAGFATPERYVDFLERSEKGYPRLALLRAEARRHADDPEIAFRLAESYEALGSEHRAEEIFRAVVKLAPSRTGAGAKAALIAGHEHLSRILIARGRSVDARSELEDARKLDPQGRGNGADRFLLTEALLLSLERNLHDAVSRLSEHLQRFPKSVERPQALFVLGSIQHELRDDASALSNLELVLREHATTRWADPARQQIKHIENPDPDHKH